VIDKKALPEVKKGPKCPECDGGACPLCGGAGGACRLCGGAGACPVCDRTGVDPGPAARADQLRALARTFLRLAAGADARASSAESEEAKPASSAEKGAPST
jgi:hypothetical protein